MFDFIHEMSELWVHLFKFAAFVPTAPGHKIQDAPPVHFCVGTIDDASKTGFVTTVRELDGITQTRADESPVVEDPRLSVNGCPQIILNRNEAGVLSLWFSGYPTPITMKISAKAFRRPPRTWGRKPPILSTFCGRFLFPAPLEQPRILLRF